MMPAASAAPPMRMILAQARVELALTMRRGESLLVTLGIPLGLLVFFATVDVAGASLSFLVPGVLALAVMSSAMVSLGIATAFERQSLALKRLGGTPLPRAGLLAAKVLAVLVIEALQAAAVLVTGLLLGWDPQGDVVAALGLVLGGSVVFAAIGLLMAGALRAEMTLALANAVYVFLILVGGMVFPLERLPAALRAAGRLLPASALSDALRGALAGGGVPQSSLAVLALWGVGASVLAVFTFRWE